MASPLYPTFEKRIDDATRRIIDDQVTPWAFLKSGNKFVVKRFDGKDIFYGGLGYEGSPQTVFWGRYIHEFLEALIVSEIESAGSLAKERKVNLKILLPEVEGLLLSASRKVFERMADIDRRLRGNGFPEKIKPRSIEGEISRIHDFISVRVNSELEMWKPKSRIEEWYESNKFMPWLIGIGVTLIGTAATILVKVLSGP